MSNEIERMFASLSADADSTPVMAATTLRSKTNRRAAAQTGLAGVALVAVVAGTAFGGQWLFAGQSRPLGPPGSSLSPTPPSSAPATTTPPSSTPGTETTRTPRSNVPITDVTRIPAIPGSIPLRAFLSKADLNDETGVNTPSDERAPLPSFCKAEFASDDTIGVRRTMRALYRRQSSPVTNIADGVVRQTVTVHKADGAEDYMADVRAAVRGCPTETDDSDAWKSSYRLLSPVDVGDDSIRIEEKYLGPAAPDSDKQATFTQQISVVRAGDGVTILWTGGYENDSAVDSSVVALTRAAHKRMTTWRD